MDLIRLAHTNAVEEVERATTRQERTNKLLEALGKLLGLEETPRRMEAYDISNTGADDIVASMTVFVDGKPRKRDYKHFKIKDLTGPDDYASMAQVIKRRFTHYINGDDNWNEKPDLLLIDGGSVHAKTAQGALEALGLHIPTFGMVKDDRHRTRALAAPDGREIGIQQNQALFALIGTIQEETHRFAIEFNRAQHAKTVKGSVLDSIPGVGPKRRADLLKHFKSIKNIKAATAEQLAEVVDKKTAQAIYAYFQKENK